MVTRVGILTVVRHTTKWQPALGLAEEKLQQQTKTSSAPLYKIKVGTLQAAGAAHVGTPAACHQQDTESAACSLHTPLTAALL